MSRDYISDVPEDVAYSLRAIRQAAERIADAVESLAKTDDRRPIAMIPLPADFTAGEASDVVATLQRLIEEAGSA